VKNGKQLKSIENIAERAVRVFFICNDTIILAHFYHKLMALRETGEVVYTIPTSTERILFCPADKGRVIFLVFQDNTIQCYDAQSGKKTYSITCPEGVRFSETGVAVGQYLFLHMSLPTEKC
jgi:outer membrane protein assembly factor BamB